MEISVSSHIRRDRVWGLKPVKYLLLKKKNQCTSEYAILGRILYGVLDNIQNIIIKKSVDSRNKKLTNAQEKSRQ